MPTLPASVDERHRDNAVRVKNGLSEDAVSSVLAGGADLTVLGALSAKACLAVV